MHLCSIARQAATGLHLKNGIPRPENWPFVRLYAHTYRAYTKYLHHSTNRRAAAMEDIFTNSKEELNETIRLSIENKEFIKLLYCLTAAKLSIEVVSAAMKDQPEPSKIAENLILGLLERLDFSGYQLTVESSQDVRTLLEKYSDAERIWFYLINQLFIHYDHNVAAINKYRNLLQTKRTQSVKKNKWGEIDDSGWAKVLAEFAEEKLYGGIFEIALKALPLELRTHLERVNALNLLARFTWVIFEADKPSSNKTDSKEKTQVKTGVDFEFELRYRIEQSVPDALVELTPASGDQGADLIVYLQDFKIVIQAKNYAGKVGNSAVQEAHAAKGFYAAHVAMVVTSSDFTQSARDLAGELGVLLVFDTQIFDILQALT